MYERYEKLRNARGITDYQVSKATGVSTSTLTDWKMNRYTPKLDKVKAIADFFGVTVDYFISK